jgi:hypothetical protein
MLPFLVVLLAYSLVWIKRPLGWALAILLVSSYIQIDIQYYQTLKAGRETPPWSSASFDLVKSLEGEKVNKVVAGDWGISRLVFYISQGRIEGKEIFGYMDNANFFLTNLREEYKNRDNRYIFYVKGSMFNRIDAFRTFVNENGIPYNETLISNRYGEPIFAIYRLKGKEKDSSRNHF